jgi:hypothetical protein
MSSRNAKYFPACVPNVATSENVCAYHFNRLFFGIRSQLIKGVTSFYGAGNSRNAGLITPVNYSPFFGFTEKEALIPPASSPVSATGKFFAFNFFAVGDMPNWELTIKGALPVKQSTATLTTTKNRGGYIEIYLNDSVGGTPERIALIVTNIETYVYWQSFFDPTMPDQSLITHEVGTGEFTLSDIGEYSTYLPNSGETGYLRMIIQVKQFGLSTLPNSTPPNPDLYFGIDSINITSYKSCE